MESAEKPFFPASPLIPEYADGDDSADLVIKCQSPCLTTTTVLDLP